MPGFHQKENLRLREKEGKHPETNKPTDVNSVGVGRQGWFRRRAEREKERDDGEIRDCGVGGVVVVRGGSGEKWRNDSD